MLNLKVVILFTVTYFYWQPAFSGCQNQPTYKSPANTHVILKLDQNQFDKQIQIISSKSGKKVTINSALERSGHEYFYLSSEENNTENIICIQSLGSVLTSTDNANYLQQITPVDPALFDFFTLFNQASLLWSSGEVNQQQQALEYWLTASSIALPLRLKSFADLARLNYAAASLTTGRLAEAELALIKLINTMEENWSLSYKAYWVYGQTLRRQRKNHKALDALEKALGLISQFTDHLFDQAEIESLTADTLLQLGEIDRAELLLQNAKGRAVGDNILLAHIYDNFGLLYLKKAYSGPKKDTTQNFDAAIKYELMAKALLLESKKTTKLVEVETNIANLYERIGDYRSAHEHAKHGLELLDQYPNQEHQAILYKNIANITQFLGQYRQSNTLFEKSISYYSQNIPLLGYLMICEMGENYRHLNDLEAALNKHFECLNGFEKLDYKAYLSRAQYELAEDYYKLENYQQAKKWLSLALSEESFDDNINEKFRAINLKARIEIQNDNLSEALKTAKHAYTLAEKARYPASMVESLELLMDVSHLNKDFSAALEYAEKGILLSKYLHAQLDPQYMGPAWSHKNYGFYVYRLSKLLQNINHANEIETLLESVSLLELAQIDNFYSRSMAPKTPELNGRLGELSMLADLKANLLDSLNIESKADHLNKLLQLMPVQKKSNIKKTIELTEIQSNMNANQAVYYFFTGSQFLYNLIITKDTAKWKIVDKIENIKNLTSSLAKISQSSRTNYRSVLNKLGKVFFQSFHNSGLINHIIIVPDSSTANIPFSALSLTEETYTPSSSKFAFSYSPSLSRFFTKTELVKGGNDLVVFANADFSSSEGTSEFWSADLPALNYSAREAKFIEDSADHYYVNIYSGKEANKKNFFSDKNRNAKVLHIASHAYFNAYQPENVGFALASMKDKTSDTNGFVTINELYNYSFNNYLIVLSGCETNQGEILNGAGKLSLSRVFLNQGAKNVVSTLWPVADSSSALFMKYFYQALNSGQAIAISLQMAKEKLRSNPRYRHPYYWAPYTLSTSA